MIKRILVPLDVSRFAEASTQYACDVAQRHNADLSCLTILDIQSIERREVAELSHRGIDRVSEEISTDETEALDRLSVVEADFRQNVRDEGSCALLEDRGVPAEAIVEMARYYDLVVMGKHSFFRFETSD